MVEEILKLVGGIVCFIVAPAALGIFLLNTNTRVSHLERDVQTIEKQLETIEKHREAEKRRECVWAQVPCR